jgi:hypothetical protein
MTNELKEQVEQLISYYNALSMVKMVNGNDDRLRNFVTDDFTHLLTALEKEL